MYITKWCLGIIGIIVFSVLFSQGSLYYYEDFSNPVTVSNWEWPLKYGLDGLIYPPDSDSTLQISGGTLNMSGRAQYAGSWDFNGFFCGRAARLTNTYNAGEYHPFGFTVRRGQTQTHTPNGFYWDWNILAIWLVQAHTNIIMQEGHAPFAKFTYFYFFYEREGGNTDTAGFGSYNGSWADIDMTSRTNYSGHVENFTHADAPFKGWHDYGTNGQNTNEALFMLTHNGSAVSIYMNPNPDDRTGFTYRNEFYLLARNNIAYKSNLQLMIGHMNNTGSDDGFRTASAVYDDLTIRSVASGINYYRKKINNGYEMVVKPAFTDSDAGIGEIIFHSPCINDFHLTAVKTEAGDKTNNGSIASLTRTDKRCPRQGYYYLRRSEKKLVVKFCQRSDRVNDVIAYNTLNKTIRLQYKHRPDSGL
ncbi:MAG TPA: hypothetical protein VKS21_09920, partial [Spirochaetota bacterium]|nr:hypothetical protein [Spirochaetota bacterium]